jgi:hypothetical protein
MDHDIHSLDLQSKQTGSGRAAPGKIVLAVMGAAAVVLALIAADVVLINGAQAAPPRPLVHVVKMSGTTAVQPVVFLTVSPDIKTGVPTASCTMPSASRTSRCGPATL